MIKKRVLVDMSVAILHNGHIRLLKKAAKLGDVIVSLSSDKDIKEYKGFCSELNFKQRKEIIESIKYVKKAIPGPYCINNKFMKKHKIDLLVSGDDVKADVDKKFRKIFPRTKNISSGLIRERAKNNLKE
jgi:glycerol-3-phosphate cytidylyltransferase